MSSIGLALARLCVGLFFAISGFHKLSNGERHEALVRTLKENRIPFISFNEWYVPAVEFIAGTFLLFGILFPIPELMLLTICCVATLTDGKRRSREWKVIDAADRLDYWLYLPEILYILILAIVLLNGDWTNAINVLSTTLRW